MTKCLICDKRPVKVGKFCATCQNKIDAERRQKISGQPVQFLSYRGHVVGLYRNGGGVLKARLLGRNPDNLPKSRTINLDQYCNGFSRAQIKKFKACVLRLANA